MKRLVRSAAWLIAIVLIVSAPFLLAGVPQSREELVREKYASWTGVLRLWRCEGWQSGNSTLTAWLTACIERFEKKHPGVYIQLTDVTEERLRAFADGSVNPPDLILYAPGMLDAPYSLLPLEKEMPVRRTLSGLGVWQGTRYAVPVALGGYALAINGSLMPDTPADWSAQPLPESRKGEETVLLDASADEPYRSWSAALLSLFAGSSTVGRKTPRAGDGIDLGLTKPAEESSGGLEEPGEIIGNALPRNLPEGFREAQSVYNRFVAGEAAAIPVTQREIRRLSLLDETGRAPDWRAEAIGLPFTDQAALISIAAWPRADSGERQALSAALIELMLSVPMQEKLKASRAFPVLEGIRLYTSDRGMSAIEQALLSPELTAAPAFGNEWREYASRLMDGVPAGGSTAEAYELLRQMIAGK